MADIEQTPLPEEVETSGGGVGAMESMIRELQAQIQALEAQSSAKGECQLRRPVQAEAHRREGHRETDKYDNHIAKFTIWYEWFRDLLENRHPNCEHVFNAIEKAGKTRVASVEDLLNLVDSGDTKIKQIIKDQSQMYMCQLKPACGRTMEESCTHELLRQDVNGIMDLLREIVYKGKNRNPNRLVELKPKALSPPRAAKTAGVDRVLTEWKSVRRQILDEDPSYKLDDKTLQTLLMKIIPNDFVKSTRELVY